MQQEQAVQGQAIRENIPRPTYITTKELIKKIKEEPELQSEVKKTDGYSFQCDRCGFTAQFDTKEQIAAYESIHRPVIQDRMGRPGRAYFCALAIKITAKDGKTVQTYIRADIVEEEENYRIAILKSVPNLELMLTKGPVYHMYGPFFGLHKDLFTTLKLANIEYEYVDNKGGNIITP